MGATDYFLRQFDFTYHNACLDCILCIAVFQLPKHKCIIFKKWHVMKICVGEGQQSAQSTSCI